MSMQNETEDSLEDDSGETVDYNQLCRNFVKMTESDMAVAHMYLQNSDWDLNAAVQRFLETYGDLSARQEEEESEDAECSDDETESDPKPVRVPLAVVTANSRKRKMNPLLDPVNSSRLATEMAVDLKILSWNIDGLDDKNRMSRTAAVAETLDFANADVVFLQEVLVETVTVLENRLPQYKFIYGDGVNPPKEYFVVVLLKRSLVGYQKHREVPFEGSQMGRKMLIVEAKYGDLDLVLINSHLESCKEHVVERVNQMSQCFEVMHKAPAYKTVIFGGDMNARDKEIEDLLSTAEGIVDLWIACGSAKETQFTWDCLRNDNIQFKGRMKPRCRFDRLYLRNSNLFKLRPGHFRLIGTGKISSSLCYPSDHWGIMSRLDYP